MTQEHSLTVDIDSDRVRARAADGAEWDGDVDQDVLRRETIAVLSQLVRDVRKPKVEELRVLGTHLYKTIFDSSIERALLRCRDEARKDGRRLLLWLSFKKGTEALADLPWEYLYADDAFLSTDSHLVLARHIPAERELREVELHDGPLRVLLIAAVPDSWGRIDAETVKQAICPAEDAGFTVECTDLDMLEREGWTRDAQPDVVHFVGVGSAGNGHGKLTLPGGAAGEFDLPDEDLASVLSEGGLEPKLVLLQLWHREPRETDPPWTLTSAGKQLIDHDVPAVVAMQYPMPPEPAWKFATRFYEGLAAGKDVGDAAWRARWNLHRMSPLEQARTAMVRRDERPWGTPVLFLRSRFALVNPPPEAAEETKRTSSRPDRSASSAPPEQPITAPEPAPDSAEVESAPPGDALIRPEREETASPDVALLRLIRAANQRISDRSLDRDRIDTNTLLMDLALRRNEDERIDWLLERLCSSERYPGEHEVLGAVLAAAIVGGLDVRASTPTGELIAAVPAFEGLIRSACDEIRRLALSEESAATIRFKLARLGKGLATRDEAGPAALLQEALAGADEPWRQVVQAVERALRER